jgi:hypothetical protein
VSTFTCPSCDDAVEVASFTLEVDHRCPARKGKRTTFVRQEALVAA